MSHTLDYLDERLQTLQVRLNSLPAALEAVKVQVNQQVEDLIAEAGLTDRFEQIKAAIPSAHDRLQREADMLKMAIGELQQVRSAVLDDLEEEEEDLPSDIEEEQTGFPDPAPESFLDKEEEGEEESPTLEEWKLPGDHPMDWRREIIAQLQAQGKKPVLPIEDILANAEDEG